MEQLGCKKKEKRSVSSRLTNLSMAKRRACKVIIPSTYSIKSKFSPVYRQHGGSCTANAVCGCDDYLFHSGSDTWIPSTIFTYYNQKKNEKPLVDDGSNVEYALKMVKKYGVCNSKVWSNDNPFNRKPSKEAYANGLKGHEIRHWYELKNMKQMKQALASGYPIACAVAWCFTSIDATYTMNSPTDKEIDKAESGHAIVIVGYNDIEKKVEFRNSWGEQWGNNGYGYMTYETFKRVVWWDDTYAVTG